MTMHGVDQLLISSTSFLFSYRPKISLESFCSWLPVFDGPRLFCLQYSKSGISVGTRDWWCAWL